MSLLFHPKTLELLAEFKATGRMKLLDRVLPLIIDNACHVDMTLLNNIVLSYSGVQGTMEAAVHRLFVKVPLGNRLVCICREVQDHSYSDMILENRKSPFYSLGNTSSPNFVESLETGCSQDASLYSQRQAPASECFEVCLHDVHSRVGGPAVANSGTSVDMRAGDGSAATPSDNTRKKARKTPVQSSTLNFARVCTQSNGAAEKFMPLELKSATFVYDRNHIVLDTQRKRDDLVNPVQLQFVKHFDQIRPPIYQRRGEIVRAVFSFKRLPQILSYDEDSSEEWVAAEESDSNALTEDSTEDAPGDEDWVEKDSEDAEVTRFNKKPTFIFQPVCIETYFDESKYLSAPLFESSVFPSELLQNLVEFKEMSPDMNEDQLVSAFSSLYLISPEAVLEQLCRLS